MNRAYDKQLKKHGRPKRIRQYIATLLFWAVMIGALVLTCRESAHFNAQTRPVAYYSIVAILILAPIIHFELYRLVTERTYCGTIVGCKEGGALKYNGEKTYSIRGGAIWRYMKPTVGYEIVVKDAHGLRHKYTVKGEREVAYAKERYHVGDTVTHVLDCKFPRLDQLTEEDTEFCVYCGCLDKKILEHTHCPNCGIIKPKVMPKND